MRITHLPPSQYLDAPLMMQKPTIADESFADLVLLKTSASSGNHRWLGLGMKRQQSACWNDVNIPLYVWVYNMQNHLPIRLAEDGRPAKAASKPASQILTIGRTPCIAMYNICIIRSSDLPTFNNCPTFCMIKSSSYWQRPIWLGFVLRRLDEIDCYLTSNIVAADTQALGSARLCHRFTDHVVQLLVFCTPCRSYIFYLCLSI